MRYLRMLLVLCFALPMCAAPRNPAIAKAHKAVHHVVLYAKNSGSASCSATAIAPHAVLTASHCEKPTDTLSVDGEPHSIAKVLRDGNDHTIYLLDGAAFANVATIGNSTGVEPGDSVFIFGNPANYIDLYRAGVVSRVADEIIFSIDGFYGDSGSAVFDDDGNVVCVISSIYPLSQNDAHAKFMGGWPLAFTAEQIHTALTFVPTP